MDCVDPNKLWKILEEMGIPDHLTCLLRRETFNIQKTRFMASGPIISWEIDGETVETVSDFILGGSKSLQIVIAAMKLNDAYSLEGKL